MKTKKRTLDTMTAAALDELYTSLVEAGAESYELENVSDALDAARKREAEAEKAAKAKARTGAKVNIAAMQSEDNRRNAKATKAGKSVDTGTVQMLLDGEPIVSIKIEPQMAVAGVEPLLYPTSRQAVNIAWTRLERFAVARVTNARAKSMGAAPSLDDSVSNLKRDLKDMLRQSIALGITKAAP